MTRPILFAAVLAAACLPAVAFAEGQPRQPGAPAEGKGAALAKEDREFINKAGLGGLYEVRAGQLAVQKAQTSDVKQLGQRMVDDHTAVNGRLQKLAQQKGLSLPAQLDKKHQEKIDSLSKKTGVDFDKAYVSEMVDDHKSDIDDFDKAAKDAKDPGVKDFAATTVPTLREHLQVAQSLKDKLKM
jgi:putative membrane protein